MAVKLRLMRMGAKKRPFYRIVATDSRSRRDGEYLELIGTYNPINSEKDVKINEEVALKWLNNGAIPSDTVRNLLKEAGIMKKFAESKDKKETNTSKRNEEKNDTKLIDSITQYFNNLIINFTNQIVEVLKVSN